MSLIKVDNLTFSYPGSYDPVFENICFQFDTNWKLGLIGRNGRGKTTFLKLLMDEYEYTGHIAVTSPTDYFPPSVPDPEVSTEQVLKDISPGIEEWRLLRELSALSVAPELLERPFRTLSGGEQTRVLLAALFQNEAHYLLIDEPTNHLDMEARALVSKYLQTKQGFLLVSHDRAFLDGSVDHILSFNRTNITLQAGTFSTWQENNTRQQQFEQTQYDRLQREIDQLQQSAQASARWSDRVERSKYGSTNSGLKVDRGYVGHQSAKLMKRAKAAQLRQERAIAERSKLLQNTEKAETLKLSPLTHYANPLVEVRDVSICYASHSICAPVRFSIHQGDRIALSGRNGCGKTSLLKLLLGRPISHTGTVKIASGLIISYVPQDTSFLRGTLDDFAQEAGIDLTQFKTILRKMDFTRTQFEKDMAAFSAGQKKKALIARSLCEQAHLYIWDEPLNYIDIYSRMQIEALLASFSPTMLFVEHDRIFAERIATEMIEIS